MNRDQARFYLAAMIDGEGHVSARLTKAGSWQREIVIANTDLAIIGGVVECCELLGYHYKVRQRSPGARDRKPCFLVVISTVRTLRRVLDEIPLFAPGKNRALQQAVASAKYRPWLDDDGRAEIERRLGLGESPAEIAAATGYGVQTVRGHRQRLNRGS